MELTICIDKKHRIESTNYVTNVNPTPHPNRIMEVHDFLYILEGTWEIYEEDTAYQLKDDDLLLLTAGNHHYGLTPSSAGNRHMYIHLYAEAPDTSSDNPSGFVTLSPLYHCANNPQIKQYFKDIIAVYWSDSPCKETKLSLLFGLLLCELSTMKENNTGIGKHKELIGKVEELMQTNPHTLYSCQEMADKFYICPRTLSNVFMQNYGMSFYAYQMNRKLEMVRQYLSDHPDELLYNVAINFGFYDEFHLSKTYKKKYGHSPKKKGSANSSNPPSTSHQS